MRTPRYVLRVHAQNLMEAGGEQERRTSLEHLIAGVELVFNDHFWPISSRKRPKERSVLLNQKRPCLYKTK
jgi:hypothetical protein